MYVASSEVGVQKSELELLTEEMREIKSAVAGIYAAQIVNGTMTTDDVPDILKEKKYFGN